MLSAHDTEGERPLQLNLPCAKHAWAARRDPHGRD
jgi:hypothetical protein